MKEKYLEVQKYPQAELSVPRASLKIPGAGQESAEETQGTLRLHGQNHPVKFQYRAKRNGDTFAVQGTMHLNMNEYGITVPAYLGITVKPDIEVAVKFDAVDKR
jgi:polyisoprenoid-binding protein YceI